MAAAVNRDGTRTSASADELKLLAALNKASLEMLAEPPYCTALHLALDRRACTFSCVSAASCIC